MSTSSEGKAFTQSDLHGDPIQQFTVWFQAATQALPEHADAMTLATANADGIPSARTVLLKEFDAQGFVFFTNYDSQKGKDLAGNPHAALVFHWREMGRQIRIAGTVQRTSAEESERYFHTRPRGSQISAWASQQSQVIESREELEERVVDYEEWYEEQTVPLPPYWGGFRVEPHSIEFWQERADRLHDRFRYTRQAGQTWSVERLSP